MRTICLLLWPMFPASSSLLFLIYAKHFPWVLFFRNFANHFAESEVSDDEKSPFLFSGGTFLYD